MIFALAVPVARETKRSSRHDEPSVEQSAGARSPGRAGRPVLRALLPLLVAGLLLAACGGGNESADVETESDQEIAATREAEEVAREPEGDCEPPREFPEELPVPPCERTLGRIVRHAGSVTWIMESSLGPGSDAKVKALFDEGLAAAGFQVKEKEAPIPGSYVLEISGHGIETGTIRFGSNNITAPAVRYDLKGDFAETTVSTFSTLRAD